MAQIYKIIQITVCTFCQKSVGEHKKTEKLYPITIGVARTAIARVCRLNADPPYDVDFIPIYMSCTECGLYLGSTEEDYADILAGTCLKCFMEMTTEMNER